MTEHAAPLPPSPDELAVQYEGLAAKVAQRNVYRIRREAVDFDDLHQVAWLAIWQAAKSYDGRIPWELYAELVARRAVNDFIRVQRRRGLTWVGDKSRAGRAQDFEGPRVLNCMGHAKALESTAWDPMERKRMGRLSFDLLEKLSVTDDRAAEEKELLDRLAGMDWVDPRTMEAVELIVRHGLTQARIARRLGVTRQRVGQLLAPIRRFLRE